MWKKLGPADVAASNGAEADIQAAAEIHFPYSDFPRPLHLRIQTARLRSDFGLDEATARLVADLAWMEGGK